MQMLFQFVGLLGQDRFRGGRCFFPRARKKQASGPAVPAVQDGQSGVSTAGCDCDFFSMVSVLRWVSRSNRRACRSSSPEFNAHGASASGAKISKIPPRWENCPVPSICSGHAHSRRQSRASSTCSMGMFLAASNVTILFCSSSGGVVY